MFTDQEQAVIDQYEKLAAALRERTSGLAPLWDAADEEHKEAFVRDSQLQAMGMDLVILESQLPEAYRQALDDGDE